MHENKVRETLTDVCIHIQTEGGESDRQEDNNKVQRRERKTRFQPTKDEQSPVTQWTRKHRCIRNWVHNKDDYRSIQWVSSGGFYSLII